MKKSVEYSKLPIAKCWFIDHWVTFSLHIGESKNIKDFLNINNISFLADMKLNINNIPIEFINKKINTLNEYLSYNFDNTSTKKFLQYFITSILDIRYESEDKLVFRISNGSTWKNTKIISSHPLYQSNEQVLNVSQLESKINTSTANTTVIIITSTISNDIYTTTTTTTITNNAFEIIDKKLKVKTLFIHIPNEIKKI